MSEAIDRAKLMQKATILRGGDLGITYLGVTATEEWPSSPQRLIACVEKLVDTLALRLDQKIKDITNA
jgi:hypothetical protein